MGFNDLIHQKIQEKLSITQTSFKLSLNMMTPHMV